MISSESFNPGSGFLTLTSVGNNYVKGEIGGTAAQGDASGSSGSLGVGVGHQFSEGWALELTLNQYSSDIRGAMLVVKRSM